MVGLSRAVSGVNHSRTGVSLLKKKKFSASVCMGEKWPAQGTHRCGLEGGGALGLSLPWVLCDCWSVPWEKLKQGHDSNSSILTPFSELPVTPSCLQGLSCGDENKLKQSSLLVKTDFSLCRLLMMLWPHHTCRDSRSRVCSQEILSDFGSFFPCCRQDSPEL